jgi:hypothetical protein
MKNRLYRFLLLFFLFLCGLVCCRKTSREESPAVYLAEPVRISSRELETSFLLHPQFSPQLKGRQALQAHLDGMVRFKYLSWQGEQKQLDRDEQFQSRLQWFRKKAMREQLFLNAVAGKIQITEAEMARAFRLRQRFIHARHLFLPTLEQAMAWRARLDQGMTFDQAAQEVYAGIDDDMAARGGRLPEFTWGDMDPAFEAAVVQLQPGQTSFPVASRWGYHIIRVDSVFFQPFAAEVDYAQDHKKIERILRQRKEDSLATLYVADLIKGLKVRVKAPAFNYIVNEARAVRKKQPGLPRQAAVSDQEWSTVASSLQNRQQEVFIVFDDGQWTIADFIRRFQAIPPLYRPHVYNPGLFEKELRDMIRDEFLDRQAETQNLSENPYVQNKYQEAREQLLYTAMVQNLVQSISIAPDEEARLARSLGFAAGDTLTAEQRQIVKRRLYAVKVDSAVKAVVSPWLQSVSPHIDQQLLAKALANLGGDKAAFITVWQPPQQ